MTSSFEECLVADVMSTELLTVAAEETTLMAWELMRQGGFHHVPVVGRDGHCIGVLDAETMAAAWDGGGPDRMRMPVSTIVGRRPPPHVTLADSVAAIWAGLGIGSWWRKATSKNAGGCVSTPATPGCVASALCWGSR